MRAALYVGEHKDLVIEDIEPDMAGPFDVVVDIGASGVCHTDLSVVKGYIPMTEGAILGHEGAGRVVAIGDGVRRVAVGDRVVATFAPACGSCWFCLHDSSHLCELVVSATPRATRNDGSKCLTFTGLGTFSEQMTVHEASVVKVETDLPDHELALLGCGVTTGVGAALNTAHVTPGSVVVVVGCGGVGQAVVQGGRIAGASRIVAIEPIEFKRDLAIRMGATDAIDPTSSDPIEAVKEMTQGRGADYVFEAIGLPETIMQAYALARRGGTIVTIGMPRIKTHISVSAFRLFYEEKRLVGCYYGSAQVRRDLPLFVRFVEAGKLDLGSLVSRRISLEEINESFADLESGEILRNVISG